MTTYYQSVYGALEMTPRLRHLYRKYGEQYLERYIKWKWEKETYKL